MYAKDAYRSSYFLFHSEGGKPAVEPQSNELTRGTTELGSVSLKEGVHIGARALLDITFDIVWMYDSHSP